MAITMFKTGRYGAEIHAVEVTRYTASSVFIKNRHSGIEQRSARLSDRSQYHETWEAARDHLMRRAETNLKNAQNRLISAEAFHGDVLDLKPPTEQKAG